MFEAWNQFCYQNGSPLDLGVARALILGYYLFFKLNDKAFDLWAWQRARESFQAYWKRPWLLEVLKVPFINLRVSNSLIIIYKTSLFLGFIGLWTQISCAVALVTGLYLMGMRHGLKLHHTVIPIHFVLLAFSISPSGIAFSLDSLVWKIGEVSETNLMLAQWGLQTIRTTFALVFFATGVAKIRNMGRDHGFATKKNLATIIRIHDFPYFYVHPIVSISRILLRYPFIEKIASVSTIVVELAFPLVLFSDLAALVLVPCMVFLVCGFRIFMGPRFDFFSIALIAIFVPWSKITFGH